MCAKTDPCLKIAGQSVTVTISNGQIEQQRQHTQKTVTWFTSHPYLDHLSLTVTLYTPYSQLKKQCKQAPN